MSAHRLPGIKGFSPLGEKKNSRKKSSNSLQVNYTILRGGGLGGTKVVSGRDSTPELSDAYSVI